MIPKIIHFIWVGDQNKRPNNCFETWQNLHPDWDFILWGNDELEQMEWVNKHHMAAMCGRELNGVADMMRWEILHNYGGIVLDADSIALRPLDETLLDCEAFACWENEIARPGLIAAGYFGSEPDTAFLKQIIDDIAAEPSVTHDMAWKTVGPQRLTDSYRKYQYSKLRIYPSHYFIPEHFTGLKYEGTDPVYAHQLWGSTRGSYDKIHRQDFNGDTGEEAAPVAIDGPIEAEAVAEEPVIAVAAPALLKQTGSQLEKIHDPYFVQRVEVSNELVGFGRLEVLRMLCKDKRVLHVGCADWPITDPNTSLHLALEPVCAKLDGADPHVEALEQLAAYTKGNLYSRIEDAKDNYDIVLVPEVMEHVPNVPEFLAQLETVDSACFFVSVPDAFQCRGHHFDYVKDSQTFVEVVHPDHNVWYTPYTFANTIKKYSSLKLEQMWFFNRISLLALLSKSELRMAA